jgi:hypothetical protein
MLAKLRQSSLDEDDAESMKLKPHTAAEAAKLGLPEGMTGAGFQIPYFTPLSKPIAGMYRYRNFDTVQRIEHTTGFLAGKVTEKEVPKYLQPKGTESRVYLPPVGNFDWERIIANPEAKFYITEGELKAACASKQGYPAMGIGGVSNFQSKAHHQRLIPDLEAVAWKEREVVIVFDSDASTNKQVALAEAQLARTLSDRGAKVKAPRLYAIGGNKTGWDDFLCRSNGPQEFDKLLEQTGLFHEIEELYRMNTEVVYVKNPSFGLVFPNKNLPSDQRRYRMQPLRILMTEVFADRKIYIEGKPKPVGKAWVEWPGRNMTDSICYEPGQPQRIGEQFNVWPGWATTPKKGNVAPFVKLYNALVRNLEKRWRMWPMQWIAYPIQHPGAKLSTALLLWGDAQGTGKTLLGQTVGYVYGNNAQKINSRDLKAEFNAWAQFKQFIRGEEITGGQSRDVADMLKDLITGVDLELNQKWMPVVTIRNNMNLYLTSNHADALYISDKDRRYFVHEVPPHNLMDAGFFGEKGEYTQWLFDPETGKPRPEAVAALHDYLLHVDLTGFDPHAHAPKTIAFSEMAAANDSEHLAWCKKLRISPDSVLRTGSNDAIVIEYKLWRIEDLQAIYSPYPENRRKHVSEKAMGLAMRAAGFEKAANGESVKIGEHREARLWIIRDDPEFARMTEKQIGDYYQKERNLKTKGAGKRAK